MEKLKSTLNSLLSQLPFNGDKTTIGLAINALLPVAVAKFPVLLALEPALYGLSLILTGVGLVHKTVKQGKEDAK